MTHKQNAAVAEFWYWFSRPMLKNIPPCVHDSFSKVKGVWLYAVHAAGSEQSRFEVPEHVKCFYIIETHRVLWNKKGTLRRPRGVELENSWFKNSEINFFIWNLKKVT